MTEIKSVLQHIRERPTMYLLNEAVTDLANFVTGYQVASTNRSGWRTTLGLPVDFRDWVAYRGHFGGSSFGWVEMLLRQTTSEEAAFEKFFDLLDEHAARTPNVVAEIVRPESNTYRGVSLPESCLVPAPEKVQLIKYTDDPGFFAHYNSEHFADSFEPVLSWITGIKGGELVVHDQESYDTMQDEDRAWKQELRDTDTND